LSFSPKITSFGFFTSAIGASARNKSGDDDISNQNQLNDYLIDRDTNIKASLKYYFLFFQIFKGSWKTTTFMTTRIIMSDELFTKKCNFK